MGTLGSLIKDEPTQVIYRPLDYYKIFAADDKGDCILTIADGEALENVIKQDKYISYPVNFGEKYQVSCNI